jgi:hypothetical protein
MAYPALQKPSQVGIREGNHEVQTFSPKRPEYPFTDRIGHGRPYWRLEDVEAQMPYALVKGRRENAVAVMDEEAVAVIGRYRFAQLLQGPLCRGMCRDVDMEQSAAGVLNDHKDVEQTKGCGDGDTEVAGHDRLRMIAHKGGPTLRLETCARTSIQTLGHVRTHGSRRYLQTELESQLIGHALLTPRGIVRRHLADERLSLCRNPWPSRTRFPAPEQAAPLTMPAEKGCGLHHG